MNSTPADSNARRIAKPLARLSRAFADRAVGLVVLIVDDAAARPVQQLRQRGLALLERRPAHVLPVELEEIERAQDHLIAVSASPEQVEHRQAVRVARDRLAIDQAG